MTGNDPRESSPSACRSQPPSRAAPPATATAAATLTISSSATFRAGRLRYNVRSLGASERDTYHTVASPVSGSSIIAQPPAPVPICPSSQSLMSPANSARSATGPASRDSSRPSGSAATSTKRMRNRDRMIAVRSGRSWNR